MSGIGKKKKKPGHMDYNANAKANGWNGQKRVHPKGKQCDRKPKVDSMGFWNKGIDEKDKITKADIILFNVRLKKGLNPFTGERK